MEVCWLPRDVFWQQPILFKGIRSADEMAQTRLGDVSLAVACRGGSGKEIRLKQDQVSSREEGSTRTKQTRGLVRDKWQFVVPAAISNIIIKCGVILHLKALAFSSILSAQSIPCKWMGSCWLQQQKKGKTLTDKPPPALWLMEGSFCILLWAPSAPPG